MEWFQCAVCAVCLLAGKWKDYPVGTTAYSYFFGAMFMGLASLYYPITGQVDVYQIPSQVREREREREGGYGVTIILLMRYLQSLYALVFAIFITSALCYLLITWTNMHLSSSIATAFWPLQVYLPHLSLSLW